MSRPVEVKEPVSSVYVHAVKLIPNLLGMEIKWIKWVGFRYYFITLFVHLDLC